MESIDCEEPAQRNNHPTMATQDNTDHALTTSIKERIGASQAAAQQLFDTYLPSPQRRRYQDQLAAFSTTRPILAAFLLSQCAICGPILLLFVLSTLTIMILLLSSGILLGALGATALIVPYVTITAFLGFIVLAGAVIAATTIWFWAALAFICARWLTARKNASGSESSTSPLDSVWEQIQVKRSQPDLPETKI
jgi:lipopolysaccharide export LptBFGC system permease protein LptF